MNEETPHPDSLETSIRLLHRAKEGDAAALNALLGRYLPRFMKWARGRIPHNLRSLKETSDLVQEVLIGFARNLDTFEPKDREAPMSYLRKGFLLRIRDLHRSRKRRGDHVDIEDVEVIDPGSEIGEFLPRENLAIYERALDHLTPEQREAVVMKVEFQLSHEDIAREMGSPSVAAARMLVHRGITRLVVEMKREQDRGVQ